MKTVYLHIGQTKAGSTAIQLFLHLNRVRLAAQGVCYPSAPAGAAQPSQHRFLMDAIMNAKGDMSVAAHGWQSLVAEIRDTPCPAVILSEETLWHLFQENRPLKRRWIQWIAQQLSGLDLRVVCYLRRQDEWLESWFHQMAKAPVHRPVTEMSFEAFCAWQQQMATTDYQGMLADWASVLGEDKLMVRPYRADRLKQGDVVADFCDWLGIASDPGHAHPQDAQQRMSFAQSAVAQQWGRTPGSTVRRKAFLERLRTVPLAGEGKLMSDVDARNLVAACEAGNQFIASRYAITPPLFAPVTGDQAAQPATYTQQELIALMLALHADAAQEMAALRQEVAMLRSRLGMPS